MVQAPATTPANDRVREMVSGMNGASGTFSYGSGGVTAALNERRTAIANESALAEAPDSATLLRDPRIRPLGQGFRAPNRVTV